MKVLYGLIRLYILQFLVCLLIFLILTGIKLVDNKEYNKIAVQEISAAYALSDKHLPMGELLNKLVDLILDLEDGTLDTEKDAIYAWTLLRLTRCIIVAMEK